MVSSKDAKEVGNRERHTHNRICMAFHLRFAAEKEWRVFISFPIRLFLNWSIEMKGRVAVTQSRNAAGKTIKKRGVPTKSMRKVFIFWCEIFADYATIYDSINPLLPPPPPRDPRPRGGHSSRHPVVE